jgi:DNA-damage-inducible protein D
LNGGNVGSKDALIVFQGKDIRRIWYKDEWWFSVVDVVGALSESSVPRRYWSDLKSQLNKEGSEMYDNLVQLKLKASDGKLYSTDCANTEGLFRIIQSVPSKKAEPFKLWLAKAGYDRVKEIEDPELAQKRMKEIYGQKGYSEDWIEKRVRGIAIRDELTDEWSKRDIKTTREYSILTAEISKATFGLTPNEYKNLKGLKRENLRDHMNDLELIFGMLGERVTTEITRNRDSISFDENKEVAKDGGEVAGNARKDAEKRIGKSIISDDNYIEESEKKKRLENKSDF